MECILGVDPGTRVTGFGVVHKCGRLLKAVDYGCIRPPVDRPMEIRYLAIFEGMCKLILKYQPTAISAETPFVGRNVQSAMKLGMARCAAMIAAAQSEVPFFEYSPRRAKQAVTGHGAASKEQVQGFLQSLLSLKKLPTPQDASDALALAVCHANQSMEAIRVSLP